MFMSLILILFCLEISAAVTVSYEGGTVTLKCTESLTIHPLWKGPDMNNPYNYDTSPTFNPALGEKLSRLSWDPTNNKSLIINNLMKNDSGRYNCSYKINGANDDIKQRIHDVSIRVLPQLPVISNTENLDGTGTVVRGTEGQQLRLQCTSTGGYPEPLLYWYKDTTLTEPLYTTNTSQEDSNGTYTVVVTHTFTPRNQDDNVTFVCQSSFGPPKPSEQTVQVQLFLNLKPSPPVVTSYPVVEGVSGEVADCRIYHFRPDTIKVWLQMNGNNVTSNPVVTGDTDRTFSAVVSYTAQLQREQNRKPLVCHVNHQTLLTPLTGNGTANVRFRPLSASLTGTVSNIVAEKDNKITLACSSGSSNPKSNITWYRGGIEIPNQAAVTESTGDYSGVVTTQIYEFAPNRSMDGEKVYCKVHNSIDKQAQARSETKTLKLLYHPIVTLLGNREIEEGSTTTLKCIVNSKPKSTVTWYHNNVTLSNGSITSDNSFEYRIIKTNRNNTGTYKCAANNGYEPSGEKETDLLVKYAPDVVVSSFNITVNDTEAVITCTPSGVPATYTYSAWEHIWPGYGVLPHSGLGNSPILKLSSLSYEYSGIYKCSASNGVTGSLKPNAGYGETYLQVKTYPIITTPKSMKISSQMNNSTTFRLEFYSNTFPNTVDCFRNSTKWNVSSSIENHTITLPVFDTTVTTMGFLAKVSLLVTHKDHFGLFTCRISNRIGGQTVYVNIVPEGPPEVPYSVSIQDVQSSSVTIQWLPGFHGGFDQTFIIEYSNKADEWLQVNITGSQHGYRFNKTIGGLQTGTMYFFRIKSVNERGTSDYSKTLNDTTKVIETEPPASNLTGIIGGASAGVVVIAVGGLVAFIVMRKGKSKSNDNETGRQSQYREGPVSDGDGMEINAAYVSIDSIRVRPTQNNPHGTDTYAQVDKSKKSGMRSENNTYSVVNKPKKEGKLVEEQNQKKEKPEKGKGKKGKKGKPVKRTGLYENAQELNVYGNIGQNNDIPEENIYENRERESPKRILNKDGLLYADLMFETNKTGKRKLIIHGLENATDYVQVDFNRKAEPLPESDEEDGDK